MARLHLSCNQSAVLDAPASSSTTSTVPCVVHVWPDTAIPLDTAQLHPAAAATFALTSSSAVLLTPADSAPSPTTLPAAIELNILRWLQPVTVQSTLPASTSTAADDTSDSDVEACIGRQLLGRALTAGMFTIASILSQPLLLHVASITTASSSTTSSTTALITPATTIHCTITTTSPAALVSPTSASSDWVSHVTVTFPTEFAALRRFISLHTHGFAPTTSSSPALLVCGSSGTGKSTLLSAVGSSSFGHDLFIRRLTCGAIIASSGAGGESSSVLSEAWQECVRMRAHKGALAVLVIDDVTPLLTTSNFPSLSSQLLALIDSASSTSAASSASPLLIAACDDSQPIASHWLRAGRFDEQLHMRPLTGSQRQRVLSWHMTGSGLRSSNSQLERVAGRMHGCSVRQLVSVWRYATLLWAEESMERKGEGETQEEDQIDWKQWEAAIQTVSSPTTTFSLLPPTSLMSSPSLQPTAADPFPFVGGYTGLKKHLLLLIHSFLRPTHLQQHSSHTLATFARPTGILLHGPAGCGKSLLVSSLAGLAASSGGLGGAPFGVVRLHVASVLSPYLGESERQLRAVFEQAKASAPCLLLVDDIDALTGSRGDAGGEGGGGAGDEVGGATRLLTTLLVLLDGIDSSSATQSVLLIATASSPATLDSALLRPGRLSNQLLVELPTADDRRQIVQRVAEVDGVVWGSEDGGMQWDEVARRTRGCNCADLCGLVRDSVWIAWREWRDGERQQEQQQQAPSGVEMRHLRQAMDAIGCVDD